MNILINALGISDSGGIAVYKNLLEGLIENSSSTFTIVINKNPELAKINSSYKKNKKLYFISTELKSNIRRLIYENFFFKTLCKDRNIDLIYNFTGSSQYFTKIPQLVKVHNLSFYSKNLDSVYFKKFLFWSWIKEIYLKRLIFKLMLSNVNNIEVQSLHVKNCISDFVNISNKNFYVKSDVNLNNEVFKSIKNYDFSKKITFLYVVGPHFHYLHKNLQDFTSAMKILKDTGINFEIDITLTYEELMTSESWDVSLNSLTNFHGYISDPARLSNLYADNTILISTSIIESLGLHVIEAIKNGIISIAPSEKYADVVYGQIRYKYDLFNPESLNKVIRLILMNENPSDNFFITDQQSYLKKNESGKIFNLDNIFDQTIAS